MDIHAYCIYVWNAFKYVRGIQICPRKITLRRQEAPSSTGSRKSMYQIISDTSNDSYWTETGEVGHDQKCDTRTCYIGTKIHRSISRNSQDLHTQALTQRIIKILMQGPHKEEFCRISTKFSHMDLYEITWGPWGFDQALFERFPKRSAQDHAKAWACDSVSLASSPQDPLTRTCKRPWPRSLCILCQGSSRGDLG